MSNWTPITEWLTPSQGPYEQRARLANADPDSEYAVEERRGEVEPMREYRIMRRSRSCRCHTWSRERCMADGHRPDCAARPVPVVVALTPEQIETVYQLALARSDRRLLGDVNMARQGERDALERVADAWNRRNERP